jgi:hypothetical protein
MLIGYFIAVLFSFVLIGIPFVLALWIWGMIDAYAGGAELEPAARDHRLTGPVTAEERHRGGPRNGQNPFAVRNSSPETASR